MTFILIVKNKNGLVMSADRRFISGENYSDAGVKIAVNKSLKIAVAMKEDMTYQGHYLQRLLTKFLQNVEKEPVLKSVIQTDISIAIARFFPVFLKKAVKVSEADQEREAEISEIIQLMAKNKTYFYFIQFIENGQFKSIFLTMKNIAYMHEILSKIQSGDQISSFKAYCIQEEILLEEELKSDRVFIKSSDDDGYLKKTGLSEEKVKEFRIVELKNAVVFATSEIIKSDELFGGNPMFISITKQGELDCSLQLDESDCMLNYIECENKLSSVAIERLQKLQSDLKNSSSPSSSSSAASSSSSSSSSLSSSSSSSGKDDKKDSGIALTKAGDCKPPENHQLPHDESPGGNGGSKNNRNVGSNSSNSASSSGSISSSSSQENSSGSKDEVANSEGKEAQQASNSAYLDLSLQPVFTPTPASSLIPPSRTLILLRELIDEVERLPTVDYKPSFSD